MTKETATEANRLYWETDKPVAEIAGMLDLSRRALYDALEPAPADKTCAVCGGPLLYANRSARESGQGTCYACATSSPQEPPVTEPEAWTWSPGIGGASHAYAGEAEDASARMRRLGGAALLGAVIGAVVTTMMLGRD
jgi:hypothetical protein